MVDKEDIKKMKNAYEGGRKNMRKDYHTETETVSWNGFRFTEINPDFMKREQRKIRQMTYLEAADYLLFGSEWSIAFSDAGWKRNEANGIVTYTLDRSSSEYLRRSRQYIDESDIATLIIDKKGKRAKFNRLMKATIRHDSGLVEEIEPKVVTASGDEAINMATEGMWGALVSE